MVSPYHRSDSPLGRMISLIETPGSPLRFLILDCPTESTLPYYLDEFKRFNVTTVVRCCQQTYNANRLSDQGIQVLDMPFKDGGAVSVIFAIGFPFLVVTDILCTSLATSDSGARLVGSYRSRIHQSYKSSWRYSSNCCSTLCSWFRKVIVIS